MRSSVLLWVLLLLFYIKITVAPKGAGKCRGPPTKRTTMHEMCSNGNQTNTEWHLYPVDYKPYETSGSRTDSFFRIGSINWRCIDLAVRCTTRTQLQMIQRCQQASAVYTVDLINSNYGVRNLDRCCQTLLQLRPGVDETQSSVCLYPNAGYEVWGHASKILFVEKCHNVLQKGSSINGYWLFVSQNNSDIMEIKKALEALLKHYPFLRLHGWKNSLVNKAACDCASFDNYILQSMQCNAPMYDRYQDNSSKVVPRKEKGLRLVDVESITIVVPKFVIYTFQGIIILNGVLFCVYIMLKRDIVELIV